MTSNMRKEALEASEVVHNQIQQNKSRLKDIVSHLEKFDPYSLVSIARGSSDHAAQFLNYLAMEKLGLLPTTLSLSILTLYKAKLKTQHSLGVAISQSGQSPDVIEPLKYFRENGSPTLALVNDIQSPLAQTAEWLLPLHAGKEQSVAATKSFIASLSASAQLIASWKKRSESS